MTESLQTNGVIGVALSSPVWASMLSNVNELLTIVLTILGIILTLVKLTQAVTSKKVAPNE